MVLVSNMYELATAMLRQVCTLLLLLSAAALFRHVHETRRLKRLSGSAHLQGELAEMVLTQSPMRHRRTIKWIHA